nr:alpha-glucosidase C-terminal domain-containing protein [Lachnospiraceae bacterium]
SVIGIGRYHKGEKILAFFNFGHEEKTIHTGEGGMYELLAGNEHIKKGPVSPETLTLPAHGFAWYKSL